MKVMFTVWAVSIGMAFLVSGRTLDQLLFSSKFLLLGIALGIIGGCIAESFANRSVNPALMKHR